MSKVAFVVKNKTQPGKRDKVRALYEKHLATRALANKDQEVIVWCDDAQDPDTFYLFEIYTNTEAPMANAQAPWFAEYLQAVMPLMEGEGEMMNMIPRWAKGVEL
ncbi:MAG TPA: hypothetical protein VFR24_25425 [Candidatus Angelobacter sp.]|nr:hypothetical protein [Candidatus Angelobacter sp.]